MLPGSGGSYGGKKRGAYHQHRLGSGGGGTAKVLALCRLQGRGDRFYQIAGAGAGLEQYSCQRHRTRASGHSNGKGWGYRRKVEGDPSDSSSHGWPDEKGGDHRADPLSPFRLDPLHYRTALLASDTLTGVSIRHIAEGPYAN